MGPGTLEIPQGGGLESPRGLGGLWTRSFDTPSEITQKITQNQNDLDLVRGLRKSGHRVAAKALLLPPCRRGPARRTWPSITSRHVAGALRRDRSRSFSDTKVIVMLFLLTAAVACSLLGNPLRSKICYFTVAVVVLGVFCARFPPREASTFGCRPMWRALFVL